MSFPDSDSPPPPSFHELVRSLSSLLLRDRLSLSSNLLWNLFRLDCDPHLGGDEETLLQGLCRLLCDVLELALEYCRDDILFGTLRCPGEPTIKSEPGDVDKLGPSDLHSDTFLDRHECELEHSETRRERLDLYISQSFFTTGIIKAIFLNYLFALF